LRERDLFGPWASRWRVIPTPVCLPLFAATTGKPTPVSGQCRVALTGASCTPSMPMMHSGDQPSQGPLVHKATPRNSDRKGRYGGVRAPLHACATPVPIDPATLRARLTMIDPVLVTVMEVFSINRAGCGLQRYGLGQYWMNPSDAFEPSVAACAPHFYATQHSGHRAVTHP